MEENWADKSFVYGKLHDMKIMWDFSELEKLDPVLRDDPDFILTSIDIAGNTGIVEYASDRLKGDEEFILAALEKINDTGLALKFASPDLMKKNDFLVRAMKINGRAIQYIDENVEGYKELALEALNEEKKEIKYNDGSIGYSVKQKANLGEISEKLRGDKDVVLAAVKENGRDLRLASIELKSDREVVLEAVKRDGRALEFADELLKEDKEVVLAAVGRYFNPGYLVPYDSSPLKDANETLKNDKEIALLAVTRDPFALEYVNEDVENYREVVLQAVKRDGRVISRVRKERTDINGDEEIALEAIKHCEPIAIKYILNNSIADDLKNNSDFMKKVETIESEKWRALEEKDRKQNIENIIDYYNENDGNLDKMSDEELDDVLEIMESAQKEKQQKIDRLQKISKLKELIELNQQQDKQISELEDKTKEEGFEVNE